MKTNRWADGVRVRQRGEGPLMAFPPCPTRAYARPANPLGVNLKLAFRAYCADLGTMDPFFRAGELYCPFCGDTCKLSTPPPACGCERGCKMCQDGPEEELLTPPDELCPNGCMKMPPQVTLRAGDTVDGGTIATFNADGTPQVKG